MRDIDDLLEAIDEIVRADAERQRARDAALPGAERIAGALPWTHRTGGDPRRDWRDVFREGRIRVSDVGTPFERQLGFERAVYFFVGSCAYPTGIAVLLFSFGQPPPAGTFNPYDTGSLKKVATLRDPTIEWTASAKVWHLASTMGHTRDLRSFLGRYIAAHFRDPMDYVRRAQGDEPDWDRYHGLIGGDRRGWTVEARAENDVALIPGDAGLREVWLEDRDLRAELPKGLRRNARVRLEGKTLAESVAVRIEQLASELAA